VGRASIDSKSAAFIAETAAFTCPRRPRGEIGASHRRGQRNEDGLRLAFLLTCPTHKFPIFCKTGIAKLPGNPPYRRRNSFSNPYFLAVMATIPKRVEERLIAGLKKFQAVLTVAKSRDVNESDIVVILNDICAGEIRT
jgi:hypothetical protein